MTSRRWLVWARVLLGVAILSAVVVWVVNEGAYLKNLKAPVVLASLLVSLVTTLLQSSALQTIALAYGRPLNYLDALRLSAVASIGNAAGGLPLGTALKFTVLREHAQLTLAQIATGMAMFSAGIVLALALFVVASSSGVGLDWRLSAAGAGLFVVAVAAFVVVLATLARGGRLAAWLQPWAHGPQRARWASLSLLVAASFVANSWVVGSLLFPQMPSVTLVFIASAGLLVGMVSFLYAIAGVQELAMALMAYAIGVGAADGAQIALTLRGTGIAAAALLLACASWRYRPGR